MDLTNINSSYLIIHGNKIDDVVSVLYAMGYHILDLKTFFKGVYGDSVLATNDVSNDELRKNSVFLLNHFDISDCIIKYNGDESIKRIFHDGREDLLTLSVYNTDEDKISYILNGISFSFLDQTRYWKPKKHDDLKKGMVVEYLNNNNNWCKKTVDNPLLEYNNFFKLLIKYDKVRVENTK
jgi:hypothetical protein